MKLKCRLERIEQSFEESQKESTFTILGPDGSVSVQYTIQGSEDILVQFVDTD